MSNKCFLCQDKGYTKIHNGIRNRNKVETGKTVWDIDKTIDVLRCSSCGLVRLSSSPQDVEEFFHNSGMRDFICPEARILREAGESEFERYYRQTEKYIKGKDVVDFGCGCGGYLDKAKKIAKSVTGIEIEDRMRSQLQDEGLNCVASLNEISNCDVITLFHVLALFDDPSKYLEIMKEHLREEGIIYIETPNFNDALLSLYKSESFMNYAFHRDMLYYFDESTLKQLSEKVGMKIEHIQYVQRYPLANHLYWLSQGGPGGQAKWEFLNDSEINKAYEKLLQEAKITDTITCVLKKL